MRWRSITSSGCTARKWRRSYSRTERSSRRSPTRTSRVAVSMVRSPACTTRLRSGVLRRGAAQSPEALNAALGMMARESDRLRVLVLDLLTLARVDARTQQKPEDFDLVAAL